MVIDGDSEGIEMNSEGMGRSRARMGTHYWMQGDEINCCPIPNSLVHSFSTLLYEIALPSSLESRAAFCSPDRLVQMA